MTFTHISVLFNEVIEALDPKPNQNFIDCTLGGGGHAKAILEKTGPNGKLLGIDLDSKAIRFNKENYLKEFTKRITLVNSNFVYLKNIVQENDFKPIDGILLDLGLSSELIESSGKGISFKHDEPLDMRFGDEDDLTAKEIVNNWSEKDIAKILKNFGEERSARQIARQIVLQRKEKQIETTFELNKIVEQAVPRRFWPKKIHPATKTYQALRIAVNDELSNLETVLKDALEVLSPNGKLAIISFHSLEDRIVKHFFRKQAQNCICPKEIPICQCNNKAKIKILTKKPIIPKEEELAKNPKSRSAKLRVCQKL